MAQTTSIQSQAKPKGFLIASNVGVAVAAAGLTTLLEFSCGVINRIFFSMVVASNALDAFAIQAKPHPDSPAYITLYSQAGDFTSPTGLIVATSGDLTAQAVGTGWFFMDVFGINMLRIQASGNGASVVGAYCGGA